MAETGRGSLGRPWLTQGWRHFGPTARCWLTPRPCACRPFAKPARFCFPTSGSRWRLNSRRRASNRRLRRRTGSPRSCSARPCDARFPTTASSAKRPRTPSIRKPITCGSSTPRRHGELCRRPACLCHLHGPLFSRCAGAGRCCGAVGGTGRHDFSRPRGRRRLLQ